MLYRLFLGLPTGCFSAGRFVRGNCENKGGKSVSNVSELDDCVVDTGDLVR